MIRGGRCIGLAVRHPNGAVVRSTWPLPGFSSSKARQAPLVRGVVVLLEALLLGMRALSYSAQVAAAPADEAKDASAAPSSMPSGAVWGSMAVAFALAVALFFLLPLFAARSLDAVVPSAVLSNLLEGLIRLALVLGYIAVIGRVGEVRRVFAYHGAEHMTIHAYEHGLPLQPQNVRQFSTAHPRCGTAFILVVVVIAVLSHALLGRPPLWIGVLVRLALIPIIAGISYEVIRFSGAHADIPLVRWVMAPSLALQALTTRKPEDDQVEVAIAAMTTALEGDGAPVAPGTSDQEAPAPSGGAGEEGRT
ncbi:MAG: DUF1385 domain-containing protein [Chloroflexi bacterium]|nr:DUF1385 domain-containing protein [Chloroflexota bacterium]